MIARRLQKNPHFDIIYWTVSSLAYWGPFSSQTGAHQMASKKSAKTQATVTLKHLAAELAASHEIAKRKAESMLGDLVTAMTKHLKKGSRLRLVGLGILQVRHRAARMGRNPATGEAIKIKASKKVAFRAAKDLRAAV
jgi:DNA-binding protein HU-beta